MAEPCLKTETADEGEPMKKKLLWPLLDALFTVTGLLVSIAFYFFSDVTEARVLQITRKLPILLAATLLGLFITGIYKSLLRYAGADTFLQAIFGTLIGLIAYQGNVEKGQDFMKKIFSSISD